MEVGWRREGGRGREREGTGKPTKMLSARRAHIIESAREFSDEGGRESEKENYGEEGGEMRGSSVDYIGGQVAASSFL